MGIKELEPTKSPAPIISKSKHLDILLTEDDKVNQMFISRVLKERGYSVDIANNGVEAVEMCDKKTYDLILMDIQMPVMDGIEATKKIMEEFPDTGIIGLSMYDEDDLIIDMLEGIRIPGHHHFLRLVKEDALVIQDRVAENKTLTV